MKRNLYNQSNFGGLSINDMIYMNNLKTNVETA